MKMRISNIGHDTAECVFEGSLDCVGRFMDAQFRGALLTRVLKWLVDHVGGEPIGTKNYQITDSLISFVVSMRGDTLKTMSGICNGKYQATVSQYEISKYAVEIWEKGE